MTRFIRFSDRFLIQKNIITLNPFAVSFRASYSRLSQTVSLADLTEHTRSFVWYSLYCC